MCLYIAVCISLCISHLCMHLCRFLNLCVCTYASYGRYVICHLRARPLTSAVRSPVTAGQDTGVTSLVCSHRTAHDTQRRRAGRGTCRASASGV